MHVPFAHVMLSLSKHDMGEVSKGIIKKNFLIFTLKIHTKMKTYYVYLLQCADDSYYIGVTNNLSRRLREHESGYDENAYTFSRRPVSLKWFEQFNDIHQALATEKRLKGWSRKKKKALIESNWDKLILFSRNYKQFGRPEE